MTKGTDATISTPVSPSPTLKRKLLCCVFNMPAGSLGSALRIIVLTCCSVKPVAANLMGSTLTLTSSLGSPYTLTNSVPLTFLKRSVSSSARRDITVIGVVSGYSARRESSSVKAVAPRFSSKTGSKAPSGKSADAAPIASRISLNSSSLVLLSTQSWVSINMTEIPARDVDLTSLISNISRSLSSKTSLTSASTRSADAPGYWVIMSALRVSILGSSIRGNEPSADSPATMMITKLNISRCPRR